MQPFDLITNRRRVEELCHGPGREQARYRRTPEEAKGSALAFLHFLAGSRGSYVSATPASSADDIQRLFNKKSRF